MMKATLTTLALLATVGTASPQTAQPQQNLPSEFTIKVSPTQVDQLGLGIAELPAKIANPLAQHIQQQLQAQIAAANPPPPAPPKAAEPPK